MNKLKVKRNGGIKKKKLGRKFILSSFDLLKVILGSIIILTICITLISMSFLKQSFKLANPKRFKLDSKIDNYRHECVNLYKSIRSNENIHKPPLKKPPESLIRLFEQDGNMPIVSYEFVNSIEHKSSERGYIDVITNDELNDFKLASIDPGHMTYETKFVHEQMSFYKDEIPNSDVMVFGSKTPWIEVIVHELGAKKIYTLDYERKLYENRAFEWWSINDYLDVAIYANEIDQFDFVFSFSTIEHAGLGQYGEALSPNGDIEALKLMHCMLKPNGTLFIALPTTIADKGYIVFNKKRVYGRSRLKLLIEQSTNWRVLGGKKSNDQTHTMYILQKP